MWVAVCRASLALRPPPSTPVPLPLPLSLPPSLRLFCLSFPSLLPIFVPASLSPDSVASVPFSFVARQDYGAQLLPRLDALVPVLTKQIKEQLAATKARTGNGREHERGAAGCDATHTKTKTETET